MNKFLCFFCSRRGVEGRRLARGVGAALVWVALVWVALVWVALVSSAAAQRIVAHRGASFDAPENTLAAFHLAWEQGADAIEGDFYLSRDGHVVCIHDATTKRTAGKNLKVAEATLEQLRKLDVGAWKHARYAGERIATLEEVLATVPDGKQIFIELKVGPEIVAPVKKILAASGLRNEQLALISFDQATIAEVRRQLPDLRAHLLISYSQAKNVGTRYRPTADEVVGRLQASGATGLGTQAHGQVVTAEFLSALRAGGLKEFHVWTVNDAATARRMQALEPYSITTDRPTELRRWLKASAAR